MFEPRIAFLAAERAMPEDIDALRRALEEQERGLREDDVGAMVNADRQFHQTLAEAARNQTFIMLHNYLSDLVAGDRREAIENSSQRRTQSPIDHRAIYDAVAAGDAAAAGAAMLQHLKNVESILLDALHRYQGAIAGLPRVSAEPPPTSEAADGGGGTATLAVARSRVGPLVEMHPRGPSRFMPSTRMAPAPAVSAISSG